MSDPIYDKSGYNEAAGYVVKSHTVFKAKCVNVPESRSDLTICRMTECSATVAGLVTTTQFFLVSVLHKYSRTLYFGPK